MVVQQEVRRVRLQSRSRARPAPQIKPNQGRQAGTTRYQLQAQCPKCAAFIRYLEEPVQGIDHHAIDFRALLNPCAVAADCAGPGYPQTGFHRRRTRQAQIAPAAKKMLFRCRLK